MAKKKATPPNDLDASSAFVLDQIKPKIERILAMDQRAEDVRKTHAHFVFQTLSDMAADIDTVCVAVGNYPSGVISGDA